MRLKRLWWIINLFFIKVPIRRANYARENNIYGLVGKNVSIEPRFVPIYSELIKFHDNVRIARNVDFTTHDGIHNMLKRIDSDVVRDFKFREQIGCIEIMENCFIGSNSTILYGVRIGPNCIVAAGSLVCNDCEPNSIYAGVPARKVGTLDDYIVRRINDQKDGRIAVTTHNQNLTQEEIDTAWRLFYEKHDSK